MIKCLECGKIYNGYKGLSSHIRQFHKLNSQEYYDKYLKTEDVGICPICNRSTSFNKLSKGYHIYCSLKCSNQSEARGLKISKSLKNNPKHIEESRKRIIKYNKSEKGRKNSSKSGKIQGPISLKKGHAKYDGLKFCKKCNNTTMHIIGIGCIACENKSENHKNSVIEGIQSKYGKEYVNVFQVPEVKEKIKQTSMEKYNCENPGNSREARIKASQTMRNNDNDSSWEDIFEINLKELGIKYLKKYNEDIRYPFLCDFYLPETDTFIEINGYWSHNDHFFDENNPEDIKVLNKWEKKAKQGHKQFINAINVWTKKDIEKLSYAKKYNLNYIVLWSKQDMDDYIKELQQ